MKKLLCFLLCLTLIFSSVSLCFATATQWDTSDQANLRYIMQSLTNSTGTVVSILNNMYSRMNTINNNLVDIKNALFDSNHSVAYWTNAIFTWIQPIYTALTSDLKVNLGIDNIISGLHYAKTESGVTTYYPYLKYLFGSSTNAYRIIQSEATQQLNAHSSLLDGWTYYMSRLNNNNNSFQSSYNWANGSPFGNIALILKVFNDNVVALGYSLGYNYNQSQTYTAWDSLNTYTFTPVSASNGIYTWLSKIQAPVARLSYILASDERIAAQEAAAANEEAVVDNFIDSTGNGSTSPSDIGSISGLSSGYKQNFGSDASVSGIFNIFDSNYMGWFSQETKDQLDTTTNTRLSKGSQSETPLLDKQIEDIYDALGVKKP